MLQPNATSGRAICPLKDFKSCFGTELAMGKNKGVVNTEIWSDGRYRLRPNLRHRLPGESSRRGTTTACGIISERNARLGHGARGLSQIWEATAVGGHENGLWGGHLRHCMAGSIAYGLHDRSKRVIGAGAAPILAPTPWEGDQFRAGEASAGGSKGDGDFFSAFSQYKPNRYWKACWGAGSKCVQSSRCRGGYG